jgi:small subunit ribosomal protein S15
MALEGDKKKQFIAEYKIHETDSGSPELQIAILTKRLEELAVHFKQHPQDTHSRQGLLKIVSTRKRLLKYLKGENIVRYRETLARHGLRK